MTEKTNPAASIFVCVRVRQTNCCWWRSLWRAT